MALAAEVHEEGRLPVGQVHGQRGAPDGRRPTPTRARPRPRSPRRSSRSSASRSAPRSSRRTRSTPSGARSRPRRSPSAAAPAGSRTSPTRSRCSSRTFKGSHDRHGRRRTTTWPSSTTRRSTRRWTRPRCSTGDERLKAWADIDKMITEDAPAVPFVWDKTTLIWSKDVNGVGNGYYDRPGTSASRLAEVAHPTDDRPRPGRASAGAAGEPPSPDTRHGRLHRPPTPLDSRAAAGRSRRSRS